VTSPLRAPHVLQLAFDRSVGGATGAFLAGLAEGRIVASRGVDGRVSVPPIDGDAELVDLPAVGSVRRWSWVGDPRPGQPLERAFAYALIQLDGADTALLHVVDVRDEEALAPGLRVRADWRDDRTGSVLDIRAFVPGEDPVTASQCERPEQLRVTDERTISFTFEPGLAPSAFFRRLADGRIVGGRCPTCDEVHVPPHERCPVCGDGPMAPEDVADRGRIVSSTVVHLPVAGLDVEVPFTWARILLDGADVPVPHLVVGAGAEVGQRVEAVWAAAGERPTSWEAIRHFRTVGG